MVNKSTAGEIMIDIVKKLFIIIFMFSIQFLYADNNKIGVLEESDFQFISNLSQDVLGFNSVIANIETLLGKQKNDSKLSRIWDGIKIDMKNKRVYNSKSGTFNKIPNEYIIESIEISNNAFSTYAGVIIGDEAEDLLNAYGEPFAKNSRVYIYYHNAPEDVWNLVFYLKDDKIEKIKIVRGD